MPEQKEILSSLKRYYHQYKDLYGIEEIGIFGSYARGNATPSSDIDIFVRLRYSSLLILSRIRLELEELFGIHTDIVQLRERMNPYLKRHIEQESIRV